MGIAYPVYGSMVEYGGNGGGSCHLTTVPGASAIGNIQTPLEWYLGGKIIGAYLDLVYARCVNSFAGTNYCTASAGVPYLRIYDLADGHNREAKSDMTGFFYSEAVGTYQGYRIYGNDNLCKSFVLHPNHLWEVDLMNARSLQNDIYVYDIMPIFRFYIQ